MKKARVLLLNPPTAAEATEPILGLAYLASSLRANGHEAKIIDATAPYKKMSPADINRCIAEFQPHFIGVTLTITYIPQTYAYMRELRKLGIPVVAGGSHVTPLPHEALDNGADIVVLGEGERTIVELADYFAGNISDLNRIKGLCIRTDKGSVYRTPTRELISNIDEIPFPAYEDFPIKNYTGSDDVNSNPIFWAVFSSRGCPFDCTFCCGHNVFGRTYRLRSAKNIFDEIKSLVDKFGVKKIAFQDDEILLSKKRILELCNLICSSRLNIKMSIRSRIDSIDTKLLSKMKEAGFYRISFGIESWNDETLSKIKKKYKISDIKKGIDALRDTGGFYINFNNIIGFPWETREHFKENLEVISKIPKSLKYFSAASTPIPYPNTELYKRYHKEYGFTNWWLDPNKHCNEFPKDQPKPLFFHFTRMLTPLYLTDIFWNYSARQRRELENYCWKIFKFYISRHSNFVKYCFVYFISRISYTVWKFSPRLERLIFKFIPDSFVANMIDAISFTKKE